MKKPDIERGFHKGPFSWKLLTLFGLFMILPGWAITEPMEILKTLVGVVTYVLILLFLGGGIGAFGFLVNHVFPKRSAMSYKVMCIRPGISFLVGLIITFVGFGLLIVFDGRHKVQIILFVVYLVGLLLSAIGATCRMAAHFLEPEVMKDELPIFNAHLRGGLILAATNIIPILGTIFFCGILLAGVGATLLGYFASMGGAVAALAAPDKEKPSPPGPE